MHSPILSYPSSSPAGSYYSNQLLSANEKKDPKKVGGLFEALFYRMVLKEVRKSANNGLVASRESQSLRERWDEELAYHLGMQGKLGIAQLIENDLKQRLSDPTRERGEKP